MQGKLSEVSNPNISDAGSKNVTENKKKSRKPAVIAVASVAAVAVLAGGGWFVWKTYANHELAEARQACVEASESYRKAADSYSGAGGWRRGHSLPDHREAGGGCEDRGCVGRSVEGERA